MIKMVIEIQANGIQQVRKEAKWLCFQGTCTYIEFHGFISVLTLVSSDLSEFKRKNDWE